jgi:hypothetical protein
MGSLFVYFKKNIMFACLCTLKQSCSKFVKEEKLFNDHLMKMNKTPLKVAHKAEIGAVWALSKFGCQIVVLVSCTIVWSLVVQNLGQTSSSSN